MSSRWKTGEKIIDEVESDWRKRINNCAQRAVQNTQLKYDPTPVELPAHSEAKLFLNKWMENSDHILGIGYSDVKSDDLLDDEIYNDLALTVAGVGSKIDVDKVHCAGDFVDSYLHKEDYSRPVEDTESFINQLLKKEIPISKTELKPREDFRKNQKARQNALRSKMEKRKEEARIRLEAQKAARIEEARRFEERKKREAKKRLEEEKLLEVEIQKMRNELEKNRISAEKEKKATRKEVIKQVHRQQESQRKLHEEKMKKMQAKFHLQAKNKLIIEKRIEAHENERKRILKNCFGRWSSVLIHRRKQQGTAAALYDWRLTKRVFLRWQRFSRLEKEKRLIHLEKTKAKRIEIYKHKIKDANKNLIMTKYFHSWRMSVRRKKEMEKLRIEEEETQLKMANLISKLKNKKINNQEKRAKTDNERSQNGQSLELECIEEQTVTPIKAWDGPVIKNREKSGPQVNTYKNRHISQNAIIESQKEKIKDQEIRIEMLLEQKLAKAREEIVELETNQKVKKSPVTKKPATKFSTEQTTVVVKSIIKPHQSVLNMKQRQIDRAERKKALEERKNQRELERRQQIKKEQEDQLRKIEEEKRVKREAILERKRIEKEKEERRKQNLIQYNANISLATNHYQLSLLKRGFNLFKRHKRVVEAKMTRIRDRHNNDTLRHIFTFWKHHSARCKAVESEMVDNFRSKWILRNHFRKWSIILEIESFNTHIAEDFWKTKTRRNVIKAWSDAALASKLNEWKMTKYADAFYTRILLRRAFKSFASLKSVNQEEEKRLSRKLKLRALVKEVIPDYS